MCKLSNTINLMMLDFSPVDLSLEVTNTWQLAKNDWYPGKMETKKIPLYTSLHKHSPCWALCMATAMLPYVYGVSPGLEASCFQKSLFTEEKATAQRS